MADSTIIEFEFEELQPVIDGVKVEGMMLYGTATLESAYPGEDDSFFVSEITLDGGMHLTACGTVPKDHPSFKKELFRAIADHIQNEKTAIGRYAQAEFSEAVRGEDSPSPVYSALREHSTWDHAQAGLMQVNGARL